MLILPVIISTVIYMIFQAYINRSNIIVIKQMLSIFKKDIKQMKSQIEKDEQ
jgi:high-affinity nickel permease